MRIHIINRFDSTLLFVGKKKHVAYLKYICIIKLKVVLVYFEAYLIFECYFVCASNNLYYQKIIAIQPHQPIIWCKLLYRYVNTCKGNSNYVC